MTDAIEWPPEAREAVARAIGDSLCDAPHSDFALYLSDADAALAALAPVVAQIKAAAFQRGAEAGIKVSADYCKGRTTSRSFGSWADAFEAAERGIRALPILEDKP